ncbi:MAG: DUF2442 domain-containing protein [Caulobacteraceae bacterium]
MTIADRMRTIISVRATPPSRLEVHWSDGTTAPLELSAVLRLPAFKALRVPAMFAGAELGEWGHSVRWPSGAEIGADTLWLETLSATGRSDTRAFLEWRLRHGLSLSATAAALGLSRRTVAYYSNGERRIPRSVLLACRGWEAIEAAA